jgi:Protein of unknown function (DUF1236)
MQKLIAAAAVAALSAALPQLAAAQSSAPTSGPAAASSQTGQGTQAAQGNKMSIRQQVQNDLAQAGYTNIRIMPDSFLVRATDKHGNPVMMVINPDSVAALTFSGGQQNANPAQERGINSKSAKMTGEQSAGTENQPPPTSKSADMSAGQSMAAEENQNGAASGQAGAIKLTVAQRAEIWQQLGDKPSEKAPSGFMPQVGAALPSSMPLQTLPHKVGNAVPAVKPYKYAMLHSQLLIVDPSTKKIVAIISE